MSNRRITVPATISVTIPNSSPPRLHDYPWKEWAATLMEDRRYGQTKERIATSIELINLFKTAEPGTHVDMRDADWQLFKTVACQPEFGGMLPNGSYNGYVPSIARACMAYIEAVEDAQRVPAHPVAVRDTDVAAG